MIVGIPTSGNKGLDEQVFDHFGKAPTYTIVDTVTSKVSVIENTSKHKGGVGEPPDILKANGATTALVGHLGQGAVSRCSALGINVLCGASGTVRDALEQFKNGKLSPPGASNMCQHGH